MRTNIYQILIFLRRKGKIFELQVGYLRNNFSIEITKMNIPRSKNSDIEGLIFK